MKKKKKKFAPGQKVWFWDHSFPTHRRRGVVIEQDALFVTVLADSHFRGGKPVELELEASLLFKASR